MPLIDHNNMGIAVFAPPRSPCPRSPYHSSMDRSPSNHCNSAVRLDRDGSNNAAAASPSMLNGSSRRQQRRSTGSRKRNPSRSISGDRTVVVDHSRRRAATTPSSSPNRTPPPPSMKDVSARIGYGNFPSLPSMGPSSSSSSSPSYQPRLLGMKPPKQSDGDGLFRR